MHRRLALLGAVVTAGALLLGGRYPAKDRPLPYRWVLIRRNLLPEENVGRVQAIMRRAKAAGYNGIVLYDFKFQQLGSMGSLYFQHVATIRRTARELGLEIYPTVCNVGYSGGLLSHDPNLAEGLPVHNALFQVADRRADLVQDPSLRLTCGDFEQSQGHTFTGWELQDYPGQATFVDRETRHSGRQSLRMEEIGRVDPRDGHGRVMQEVAVSPFRQYHLSVWIRTDHFERPRAARVAVLTPDGQPLSFARWNIEQTQDWKQYHAVFNSLDNHQVKIYLGVWEAKGGKIWWDDVQIEEVGLLNALRRPGCPLTVKGDDGTVYREGKDFEPVRDPRLGTVPWPGEYDLYHGPPTIRLTPASRLQKGQKLRVSFYHVVTVEEGQVTCCLSEPKVYSLLKDEIGRVDRLFQPPGFFLGHDEIRQADWCAACRARHRTPGQLLADNVNWCVRTIRSRNPRARVFVWSDMFDPFHNAHDHYYLVRGTWAGSWEGLPRDVVIVNWNSSERQRSMPWFARRGHSQVLAGYYDGPPGEIRRWLDDGRGIPNILGVIYATWEDRYDDLEAFAQAAWGGSG
jgi:hypothetical protein